MSNAKVLIVDDDANVLKAYERRLRRRFDLETALCSEEGVTAVNFLGPFAVIVSDMQMPRVNGAQFLQRITSVAPESVRIMLTGNADQATAAAAINEGQVFRFLNKPCDADDLAKAIDDAIHEHQRRIEELELVRQAVSGSIEMMSRVLAITKPEAFGRAARLKKFVASLAEQLKLPEAWEYETAAVLSQLGWITVPEETLNKHRSGAKLTKEERQTLDSRFDAAADLIAECPKLDRVAEIVRRCGTPPAATANHDEQVVDPIERGRALIDLAESFDELTAGQGITPLLALEQLGDSSHRHDHELLAGMRSHLEGAEDHVLIEVRVSELQDGMELAEDVVTTEGAMLVSQGQEVTLTLRQRLSNYCKTHSVKQPIHVLASRQAAERLRMAPEVAAAS
ncbi:Hydrogenase transcriptional regulatory protein hupR1 [Posidoniimonas polymericola]|uniref:Hydrogenase transcriptional regulatory protein hupR1 n=1 Tax=Posidoniimonas polymericola TaxID=2528002 RepID=A0A5C5YLW2_9BACT|nr:HD domain-containing phosphohydrolase [Posidoniimonas polymericola]TWT75953.1 Hydrogenase transcriptional regulatory protein hupR1 [Posidoniimonas polymericola]